MSRRIASDWSKHNKLGGIGVNSLVDILLQILCIPTLHRGFDLVYRLRNVAFLQSSLVLLHEFFYLKLVGKF